MILVIDTHAKMVKICLFSDSAEKSVEWEPGRELSATILTKIDVILEEMNTSPKDIDGVIVNSGPGSFTSLRIGISIANAFAYSNNIPVVGVSAVNWEKLVKAGTALLVGKKGFTASVLPEYGSEPNITTPKKK